MKTLVNYTAAIELTTKTFAENGRLKGRFYASRVGHEAGVEDKTAPVKSFKVIDNKVYAETASSVFHVRNLNGTSLAEFNTLNLPVYVKKADPVMDELINTIAMSNAAEQS
ncbi:hypothetical protein VPHD480_0155 [Vibrio phage D480]|nr:hypothetical protein MYOV011v1_p0055 [Vibrio phage 6E35.1a]